MNTKNLSSKEMLMRSKVLAGIIDRMYKIDTIKILTDRQLSYKRSIASMQQEFQEQIDDNYEELGGNGFRKSDDRTRMWLLHSISLDEHRRAELLDGEYPLKKIELKAKRLHALADLYAHSANGLSDDIIENDFVEIIRVIIDEAVYFLECQKKSAQYLRNIAANQVQIDKLYLMYAMTENERKEKDISVRKSLEYLQECAESLNNKDASILELKKVLKVDVLSKLKEMDWRILLQDNSTDIFCELYSQALGMTSEELMQDFTR